MLALHVSVLGRVFVCVCEQMCGCVNVCDVALCLLLRASAFIAAYGTLAMQVSAFRQWSGFIKTR
jgi:hypothetical protein